MGRMHTVLVAGGGVGGLACAHRLSRRLPEGDRVVVFDHRPVHTFWPSLLWVMTGTRRSSDVARPFGTLRDARVEVVQAPVTAIDPKARTVQAGGQTWTGDALVVALGAALDPDGIPGLGVEPGNFYTTQGAEAVWTELQALEHGRAVVAIPTTPFKCPAAPYEAAMLIDGYLRKRGRRAHVSVELWAAEAAPMAVAGPAVSHAVEEALAHRDIAYHPSERLEAVAGDRRQLTFTGHPPVDYDLLAYVPPHRVPEVVASAGLAPADGWVSVDRHTLETPHPGVYAIGDVVGISLTMGKPLPKAGVFAFTEGEVVADRIVDQLAGRVSGVRFDGRGECFIEMGRGQAGFARGQFFAEPAPAVRAYRSGRHWHAAKLAFERQWWSQWW